MSDPNVAPGLLNFVKPPGMLKTSKFQQKLRFRRNTTPYKNRYCRRVGVWDGDRPPPGIGSRGPTFTPVTLAAVPIPNGIDRGSHLFRYMGMDIWQHPILWVCVLIKNIKSSWISIVLSMPASSGNLELFGASLGFDRQTSILSNAGFSNMYYIMRHTYTWCIYPYFPHSLFHTPH